MKSRLVSTSSLALLVLIVLLSGCSLPAVGGSLNETQVALGIQQTLLAQTATAQSATLSAPTSPPPDVSPPTDIPDLPTPDLAATQVAISVQETMAAGSVPPATPGGPVETPLPPTTGDDFETWMRSANIVLYEDIVNEPQYTPYVQRTLKAMSLQFKDDGSAKGWFKSDLLSGAPNGQPWDLVILAIEARSEVSGEYFEYLNDVLNQGSSVIVEAWHLDEISQGTVSTILARCGVQVYPYFPKTGTLNDVVMWPLGIPHPVLSQPNSGMSFTYALDTWLFSFDLGSLMALTGSGDAQLLLGTNATEKYQDGTLAVCLGGQLTLQTFSSHSFPYDRMFPLWQNYIYNALQVRYSKR
ncbi:MAG: hypothetical protein AB1894_10850 [Chloroflexota bacterium]